VEAKAEVINKCETKEWKLHKLKHVAQFYNNLWNEHPQI